MSTYTATTRWDRGDDDFLDRRYHRRHAIRFDGGVEIVASSSPQVVPVPMSDPSAVDPEEAFVASISSCHLLWFLSIAASRGFRVDRYEDRATGTMARDARGRPIRTPIPAESDKGILVHPSNVGGTNWWSPSMDPARKLFFVPTLERGQIFFPGKRKGNFPAPTGSPHYTAVRALDAASGRLVWEHRHPPRYDHDETGGLLSTKSGLVFGADMQTFFALDAKTGQRLWAFATGGHIAAAPVTYAANGRQFVAIAAGASLIAFGLPP